MQECDTNVFQAGAPPSGQGLRLPQARTGRVERTATRLRLGVSERFVVSQAPAGGGVVSGPAQPHVVDRMFKRALARVFWTLLGRRNMFRFARFLLNEGRLDSTTSIRENGEAIIQRTVLQAEVEKSVVTFDVGAYRGW